MNTITTIWGLDDEFKLILLDIIQGNDLTVKILNLPAGYNLLSWTWKNTKEPVGGGDWNNTETIQSDSSQASGSSVVFNPNWNDENETTRFATVTIPLSINNSAFDVGNVVSFIYKQNFQGIQIVFKISDKNPAGSSGGLPIPISEQQDRTFLTIGKNDGFASFGTSDYTVVGSGDLTGNTLGSSSVVGSNNKISTEVIT